MKLGIYGQQLPLMDELKAATFSVHARLQTAPFFQALATCQLPLESYVGQLRALSIIHGVLERAIENCPDERSASVWTQDMRKLLFLQQDLQFFEPRVVPDIKETIDITLQTMSDIRLRSVEQPLSLLGCIYVLEGSTLGAQVLRPLYARALLLTDDEGLSYLGCYGQALHSRWTRYQQRMNALYLNEKEREQLVQAAKELFYQMDAIYRTLYPIQSLPKTFLITSINPEAGRHPMPTDEREIKAALCAADRCWQKYPYFDKRYGERGRRFARSDAVWLTTLYPYEPAQIIQQVRWLACVLAGRGMPSLLLQEQLEMLVDELVAVIPARKSDYEKLRLAAANLHESRRKHLTDDQVQCITNAFENAVGPQWSAQLPHTGILLAAAVADKLAGANNAVESIQDWMTDNTRFPLEWVIAVQYTLVQAYAQSLQGTDTHSLTNRFPDAWVNAIQHTLIHSNVK